MASDDAMVNPNITIPACSKLVPIDLSIISSEFLWIKAKATPRANATKGEPYIIAIKANGIPIKNFILLNVELLM